MRPEVLAPIVTGVVLFAVVAICTLTGGRVEITLNDAIIAAIAAGLTLLMSGFITKLGVSTAGVTIETARDAILQASARPVGQQVSPLPVAQFNESPKGGVNELARLVDRRVQGVDFVLGRGSYIPDVVSKYLETLTQQPSFKAFVLLNSDASLFGVLDGRILLNTLTDPSSGTTFPDFTAMLNDAAPDDLARLSKLPGFVPKNDAATPQDDKSTILARMERVGIDWWPAVNKQGGIAGYVDRARLVASLILDVTDQLRSSKPGAAAQQ